MYNRQISELGEDGIKHVIEKGWFVRGTKLLVTGFRRDDTFVGKTYKNNGFHQLYKMNLPKEPLNSPLNFVSKGIL